MTRLAFLSPDRCAPDVRLVPPAARALAGVPAASAPIRERFPFGVLELRGDVGAVALEPGEELVRATPRRAFLLTGAAPPAAARERLSATGLRVYDLSGALAAFELDGVQLMRRLTDLDLDALPAVGPVGRGVWAIVDRLGDETFRVLCPQELAHSLAELVLDLAAGLDR